MNTFGRFLQGLFWRAGLFVGLVMISPQIVDAKELKIVTTTSDLASIARSIAGERAKVTSICTGRENPHFIQAKPSYIMLARDADLWIRAGMELEVGWEGAIIDGSRNSKIRVGAKGHLDASEKVLRLGVPSGRMSKAMGDVHPLGNPHYWLDPLNGRIIAKAITERLTELLPAEGQHFEQNLREFQKTLDEHMFGAELVKELGGEKLWVLKLRGTLDQFLLNRDLKDKLGGWSAKMRPLRGKKIVTYHRSWVYFANRFALVVSKELEPKPGIPPSPAHLAKVVKLMKEQQIRVILMEPFYSRRAADLVASKTGAGVVVCANSVGGQEKVIDYVSLIDLIVNNLSQNLHKNAPLQNKGESRDVDSKAKP
ncbi:MAG: metal ABC transporter substrate-binding protein [Planctomycetota bacterium]|nr:metal ABC transporter substrate-binding protein [Planctomycetota bacterium]